MAEKMIIVGKIDVMKIRKEILFAGKNGAKYLDFVLLESPDNAYGNDFMVTQSISKEEREAGVKGPILGNAKFLKGKPGAAARPAPRQTAPATGFTKAEVQDGPGAEKDDLPF